MINRLRLTMLLLLLLLLLLLDGSYPRRPFAGICVLRDSRFCLLWRMPTAELWSVHQCCENQVHQKTHFWKSKEFVYLAKITIV